jgi:hypothetical protein
LNRPGDAVGDSIAKKTYDIGMAGMYVTAERNAFGSEMSVAYDTDCAAFITLTSKALPRRVKFKRGREKYLIRALSQ